MMCISFGNPSEPCCKQAIPEGWSVSAPLVNDMVGDDRLFVLDKDGYTSFPSSRSRDVHFRLERRRDESGEQIGRLTAYNPAFPPRTVFGTSQTRQFWSDVEIMPPIRMTAFGSNPDWFRSNPDLTDWPAQLDAGDVGFGGGGVSGVNRNGPFHEWQFRIRFPGGTIPFGLGTDRVQLDPVTSSEVIARQITGRMIGVLCRGRIIGGGYEGFDLQHLVGADFWALVPVSVSYNSSASEWQFGGVYDGESPVAASWFPHTSFELTGPNSANVTWSAGVSGTINGTMTFKRISR